MRERLSLPDIGLRRWRTSVLSGNVPPCVQLASIGAMEWRPLLTFRETGRDGSRRLCLRCREL